jgi:hypothetical protein
MYTHSGITEVGYYDHFRGNAVFGGGPDCKDPERYFFRNSRESGGKALPARDILT